MGGTMIFVDEAHFIKEDVIKTGPLAMLGMDASIVLASTPATGKSGIEGILNGEIEGVPICTQVDLSYICPACALRKKENPDIAHTIVCDDRAYLCPPMTSKMSLKIAAAATSNDPGYFEREHAGVTVYNNYSFIDKKYIDAIRNAPCYTNKHIVRQLFVSIDPNRGSRHYVGDRNSDYAFVTCYFEDSKAVVNKLIIFFYFFYCFLFSLFSLFFSLFFFVSVFYSTDSVSRQRPRYSCTDDHDNDFRHRIL